jgi:hypothetical protein
MRKDMGVEEEPVMARVAMPTIEEPELSDEELLGAATLAKISTRVSAAALDLDVFEDVVGADEIAEEDEFVDVEDTEDAEDVEDVEVEEEFVEDETEEAHEE